MLDPDSTLGKRAGMEDILSLIEIEEQYIDSIGMNALEMMDYNLGNREHSPYEISTDEDKLCITQRKELVCDLKELTE
jgi:hypothetical protein